MKKGCLWIFLLQVFCATFPTTSFSQAYEFTVLPFQFARAMNDSGAVIGNDGSYSYLSGDSITVAIGGLYLGGSASAQGINNSKQVVGSADSGGITHAFLWQNSVMTTLGVEAELYSEATCINDSGWVAGNIFDSTGAHPFFWKEGVVTAVATPGDQGSGAAAMNNAGQVTGASRLNDSVVHAYLWQEGGGMTDLGTLGAGYSSEGRGINNAGQVVGYATLEGTSGGAAVLWSGGGIENLGVLGVPGGNAQGYAIANDINDDGSVVGTSTWSSPTIYYNNHAFVWKDGVMTDLNSVTDTSGGWTLISAVGISNSGDIVCFAVQAAYPNYVQSVYLKRGDILVTNPKGGELWISGERDTVRWISGLPAGGQVDLEYSLDDGNTWELIKEFYPADSGKYIWTVPDTISGKARILITSSNDFDKYARSNAFRMKGYVLTETSASGDYIAYNSATDRWGFGNFSEDVWPASWHDRFEYTGTDPFTGRSYLYGTLFTSALFISANSAAFPDWPSWVNAFGIGRCYISTSLSIYSPTAVAKWALLRKEWNGSCFGIAISNAIAFRNKTAFRGKYSAFPDYLSPNQVVADTDVIPVISELFTHQYGEEHYTYRNTVGLLKTPTETIQDLKAMLISDDAPVRTLSIMNNGPGGGGHAILAYRLRQDTAQPNIYYVSVYDNSYPNVLDATITVDTAQNGGKGSWHYPAPAFAGWGGPGRFYLRDPATDYLTAPSMPKAGPEGPVSSFDVPIGKIEVIGVPGSPVSIRDAQDRLTGYVGDMILDSIPGSAPLVADDGSETPPYGYILPDSVYSITTNHFSDTLSRMFVFTPEMTFGAERSGADSGQTDRFSYDGGFSVVNPDAALKTYHVVHILDQFVHQGQEKVFSIRSVALSTDDSLRIDDLPGDGLKLGLSGASPRSYSLELELDNYFNGAHRFVHDLVPLAGNSSHVIVPNWSSLEGSVLTILIDQGNDGTIDDSMSVTNDLTDAGEPGGGGLPAAFALYQNYPNPFNPATTIGYALPNAAVVTLKIYDVFGREVATLADGPQAAGFHSVEWNASDLAGGVYFYRLQSGSEMLTRKLLLVK